MKNWKMNSIESRSSGHSDNILQALPAKSVPLTAAKQLLILIYDENCDEMFAVFYPKECLTLIQSTKIKAEQQRCSINYREQ